MVLVIGILLVETLSLIALWLMLYLNSRDINRLQKEIESLQEQVNKNEVKIDKMNYEIFELDSDIKYGEIDN